MGKVKQIWQDERDKRWGVYYDFHRAMGCSHDEAVDCANDQMDEDDLADCQGE